MDRHIAVPRRYFELPYWRPSKTRPWCENFAWLWLVAQAAETPRTDRSLGKPIELETGQLIVSIRSLREAFGWSRSKAVRFVQQLERARFATTERHTLGRTLHFQMTICDFEEKHLCRDTKRDSPGRSAGPPRGQTLDLFAGT